MCGLTFAGSNSLGFRDMEVFEQMVFSDTLRGDHSTGVCSIFKGQESEENLTKVLKAAMNGPSFIKAGYLEEAISIRKPSTVGKHVIITRPIAVFGHNRFATKGEVSAKNAHPFTKGKITLAHNGTLTGQHRLPDYKDYEVDSENIAHSIDKIGFVETLKLLEGAFTLIWYNHEDSTVNIIRNKERPFYLVKTSTNDWFGASEKDMLLWILGRQKSPITVTEQFECEPGVQYIFSVNKGVFSFKEKVKHELPNFYRFQYVTNQISHEYGDDSELGYFYNNRNRSSTASSAPWKKKEEAQSEMMKKIGMNAAMGDQITFKVYEHESSLNFVSEYCTFKGYLDPSDGIDSYVEVVAHGQKKTDFDTNKIYKGKVLKVEPTTIGGIEITVGGVVTTDTAIDTSISPILLLPSAIGKVQEEDDKSSELLKEYGIKTNNIQFEIGDEILFEAMGFRSTYPSANMGVIYGKCIEDGLRDLIIETEFVLKDEYLKDGVYSSYIKSAILEVGDIVVKVEDCELVATNLNQMCVIEPQSDDDDDEEVVEYSIDFMADDEDVPFFESTPNYIKTTKTGEPFTESVWNKSAYSDCCECGNPIPFDTLDKVSIIGISTFCEDCDNKRLKSLANKTEANSVNGILKKHKSSFEYGDTISFVVDSYMPYGTLVDNVGSVFGKSTIENLSVIATNFKKTDFKKGHIFSGKIASVKIIANEFRVYVSGPFAENRSFFFCEECNKRLPLIQMDTKASKTTCYKCNGNVSQNVVSRFPTITLNKPVRILKNGHTVPKALWNSSMGICKHCGNGIPWELAETTTLIGGVPICQCCEKKLA